MCITYIVEGKLYVNITNKCSNRCEFCIRNNGDGAYGSDSLWLEREPSREEILNSVFSHNLSDYSELVFCGYGEPTYRLDDAVFVAKAVKGRCPEMKIRINTNGHSDLILGRRTAPDFEGAFDTVSISLNTPSRERYQEICHSVFKESAFDALLEFAKENPQIHIKFDNVWEKFPDEIKRSFLSQLAACKGAYLGISCANLDCIKMAVEMVEGITIHYDDINIEDERLETLTQICKGHELYIWLLGKTVKPKWFKGERATLEMCLQAKKYAKLGIWVLATEEELDVAVNVFGADLVETNGQLKPAMVEAISKSK